MVALPKEIVPYLRPAVLYAVWVGLFFLMFLQSWICEDAYITFRVIDNVVHGYGLRWNIHERVQVYTHPLWLLLQLPFAFLWDNIFYMNIALSLLCSSVAVGIVLLTFRKPLGVMLIFCLLPLFLSKAFIEFASSGLETPLSFLLFAALGYALVHWQERPLFPFILSLLVSLLLLNRLDHAVLIAPLLMVLAWRHYPRISNPSGMAMLVAGALPLLGWFCFSLWYYGFLFPNTKYAKLDTDLPFSDYLAQGLQYSFIWLTHDTLSVVVTLTSLVLAFVGAQRNVFLKAIAVGIVCNLAYVVAIGGDYMMGRFFAFIFFVANWLLLACVSPRLRTDVLFASALAFVAATTVSYAMRDIRTSCSACIPVKGRVLDGRSIFGGNALFTDWWPPKIRSEGQYKFAADGKRLAKQTPAPTVAKLYVGMLGYYAGPDVVIVDELALGDALLARLPADDSRPFYVGHYRRALPKGYMDAVEHGIAKDMDPNLAAYYAKLKLITQGELWDSERLITLLRFNFGHYDAYKHLYLSTTP